MANIEKRGIDPEIQQELRRREEELRHSRFIDPMSDWGSPWTPTPSGPPSSRKWEVVFARSISSSFRHHSLQTRLMS